MRWREVALLLSLEGFSVLYWPGMWEWRVVFLRWEMGMMLNFTKFWLLVLL
jgi:hypothetical protein